ncbi:MAG: hypothetical protein RQ722_03400 [Desulfuromonadales bacterium]|nr:hypothetical protein [Desulfuromonadales bacterium]
MINRMKHWMGRLLTLTLLSLSLFLIGHAILQFLEGLNEGKEMVIILIKSINTSIIALIIFSLQIKTAWAVKEQPGAIPSAPRDWTR